MIWSLDDVRVTLGGRAVLAGASLSVAAGEKVLVVGPSGGGKSTLVRAGLGLAPVSAGRVTIFGRDAAGLTTAGWREVRRRAQLLLQDPLATLHPDLPVGASLEESARLHPAPGSPARRAAEALGAVGLSDVAFRLPRTLSGGERRRASVARVWLARPELLVADEPTAGLDEPLQAGVAALLARAAPTLVVVTHDAGPFLPYADRIVVLADGRIGEEVRRGERPRTALGQSLWEAP